MESGGTRARGIARVSSAGSPPERLRGLRDGTGSGRSEATPGGGPAPNGGTGSLPDVFPPGPRGLNRCQPTGARPCPLPLRRFAFLLGPLVVGAGAGGRRRPDRRRCARGSVSLPRPARLPKHRNGARTAPWADVETAHPARNTVGTGAPYALVRGTKSGLYHYRDKPSTRLGKKVRAPLSCLLTGIPRGSSELPCPAALLLIQLPFSMSFWNGSTSRKPN